MLAAVGSKILKGITSFLLLPLTLLVQLAQWCLKTRLSERMRFVIEVFSVTGLVLLLSAVNWYVGLERYLVGPPLLRKVWLGLVALLCYLTVRLFLAFLHQIPRTVTEFPDIRAAFLAGLDAIANARMNFRDTPLFLVVGAELEAEAAFAKSALVGGSLDLADPKLPVHWFGKSDAIWVSLPGVSAISQQAARDLQFRSAQDNPSIGSAAARLSVEEKELARRRLEYLVSLLRDARKPVVPVNGLVLMVPYSWISDPGLSQLIDTVKIDMLTLQCSLGVRCLCQIVIYGIESSPVFEAYVDRVPAG